MRYQTPKNQTELGRCCICANPKDLSTDHTRLFQLSSHHTGVEHPVPHVGSSVGSPTCVLHCIALHCVALCCHFPSVHGRRVKSCLLIYSYIHSCALAICQSSRLILPREAGSEGTNATPLPSCSRRHRQGFENEG